MLRALSGGIGFPGLHWLGTAGDERIIVTDRSGDSLEYVFDQGGRYFELQVLLEFAHQLICRLEWMHSRCISHGNLEPSCFTLGLSSWQAPQINISNFGTADLSEFSARKDLKAVGDILVYFATAYPSWDSFKASTRSAIEIPSIFNVYFTTIQSKEFKLADYTTLRNHFHGARQLLSRTLFGGLSDPQQQQQMSLKCLSMQSTGDLFENLGAKLSSVGQIAGHGKSLWRPEQAGPIAESLDEIMAIFMVLLIRDRPSHTRRRYLMGAFHLPNRLWRDLRWYLCMASRGSISFQRLITLRIYKYIGVLLEVIPSYNKYWTIYLSELACAQMSLDGDSSQSWKQAWIYWKNCANYLKSR